MKTQHFIPSFLLLFFTIVCFAKQQEQPDFKKTFSLNWEDTQPQDLIARCYFDLIDAYTTSDSQTIALKAKQLLTTLTQVEQSSLTAEQQKVWPLIGKKLIADAQKITDKKSVERQRTDLISLSENMYLWMKATPSTQNVYYHHCPMANGGKGANWLSLSKTIQNPYYGSAMQSCGSTIEVLQAREQ